jgi:hypothetical protein
LHGTYHGFGPDPLVAFDIFRVDADGKLAEHWDALTPLVEDNASGRSQTDGPTSRPTWTRPRPTAPWWGSSPRRSSRAPTIQY